LTYAGIETKSGTFIELLIVFKHAKNSCSNIPRIWELKRITNNGQNSKIMYQERLSGQETDCGLDEIRNSISSDCILTAIF
jgi:hypothetical protein